MNNEADRKAPECRYILPLLSEYLDAELPGDMCDRVAAHLLQCPSCLVFVESLRSSIALCRELECELTPEPLPDKVKLHLRHAYETAVQNRSSSDSDKS